MTQSMTTSASSDPSTSGWSVLAAGALAGVAGGVAMAAYLVLAATAQGLGPFTALEPLGATFRDAEALGESGPSLTFGLILHLAVSSVFGMLFASVLPRDHPPWNAAIVCIGFAFVVMGVMTSCVVPGVNPVLKESFHGVGGSWVIAHALFGLTVGYLNQRLRQGFPVRAVPRALDASTRRKRSQDPRPTTEGGPR